MRWIKRFLLQDRIDYDVFPPAKKPFLRGWSHAVAALLAVVGLITLLLASHGIIPRTTLAVYGGTLVLLLTVSALYHLGDWPTRARKRLQTFDHANIFLFIAGTYTPIGTILLHGWLRPTMLIVIWSIAAIGIATTQFSIRAPRGIIVGIYILMGWSAVVIFRELVAAAGVMVILIVFAGVTYSLGAVIYATKWPNPWPRIFGYHEIFHLAVIAASALIFAFMFTSVLPRA